MSEQETYARVYRHGDRIAFSTDNSGKVLYLPAELARGLAALLIQGANDVDRHKFTENKFGTRYAGKKPDEDYNR